MLLTRLTALECSLHGPRRKDREWLEQILHPEFSEITRSGSVVDRAETLTSLVEEVGTPALTSSGFRFISASDHFAILTYRTCQADGSRAALRTSYWARTLSGQWQLVFHQGTPEAGSQ